jgi:UDP-N-acetylglucosamine diphosphorylase/glucosamine-1-phosphate N-acetyltransferase
MQVVLFDDELYTDLLPFTFTRAMADLRVGILTIKEKWEKWLESRVYVHTREAIAALYESTESGTVLYINGALLPDETIVEQIKKLKQGEQIVYKGRMLAMYTSVSSKQSAIYPDPSFSTVSVTGNPSLVNFAWNIFGLNDQEIKKDFALLTKGRKSAAISSTNQVIGVENVFIEKDAKVECSIINAATGPVYIAAGAQVMEGCIIRGPFALGEHAVLKMGTRIYGATTIGQGSKVGGEISNSVIFANSNKAHDGFLGNSVIGQWCNLGADTNNSNLKNNYGEVSVWNYTSNDYLKTGLQFCGLFMGDHSKCGINTMFNTGTTVGVCANIFGAGFPDKYLPSFTWGGIGESETFLLDKVLELASRVMERRGIKLSEAESKIISQLYMEQLKPKEF